jgi:2-polyprenyl-3-methyl-5-hydroxy-6-metoxy-1,4-benzoquinol methylase
MTTSRFDSARSEAFGERMTAIVNGGALSLMVSIGHRAGLFDVMRRLPPATSHEVAREAGLAERYVREWLGAMATGAIVEYEPELATYRLPPEHAAWLTRDARPRNLAATAQWIPLLARVEDAVLACFERGGGVPYAAYQRFHEVMAEESDQTTVWALLDGIVPIVPGLAEALAAGIDVLDVGCGVGRALGTLARAFPKSRFTGFDLSSEAIAAARTEAAERRLENVHFAVRDVADLGRSEAFDLVTAFDAIHHLARPEAVLRAVARALRPSGTFLMQDVRATSHVDRDAEHPLSPFLYTVSCLHCLTVSLAGGGAGLGAMWGAETARRMLAEAGLDVIDLRLLPHDPFNQYYVARKSPQG